MTDMNPERTRNLALLRRLYDGLDTGRVGEIAATFSPAIVIHLRGAGRLDGTFRGLAEARSLYQRVLPVLGPGFTMAPYECWFMTRPSWSCHKGLDSETPGVGSTSTT
jgi:hypothetical protein